MTGLLYFHPCDLLQPAQPLCTPSPLSIETGVTLNITGAWSVVLSEGIHLKDMVQNPVHSKKVQ